MPPEEFVGKYLPEAEERINMSARFTNESGRKIVLLCPDVKSRFPLFPRVMKRFLEKDRSEYELLIYLSKGESTNETVAMIEKELRKYDTNCYVTLQTDEDIDEHALFDYADIYITTRHPNTVKHTCLCDIHNVKVLYGTDEMEL